MTKFIASHSTLLLPIKSPAYSLFSTVVLLPVSDFAQVHMAMCPIYDRVGPNTLDQQEGFLSGPIEATI
jgi:hypothetical protein